MQLKAIYWSGDNMTSPLLLKMFIMSRILFPVCLICSGNFRDLQSILIVCYFTVCVAFCIKMNFQNCISIRTSVPVVYNCRAIFTVCLGIFI